MFEYELLEIRPNIIEIRPADGECCKYLFVGDERALLVDTGTGAGDLRAAVAKVTDKPLMVANTHGHFDHSLGNRQFEQVWMSPMACADVDAAAEEYAELLAQEPEPGDTRMRYDYERLPLRDGDRIDLGGMVLEVIETPGHTPGCLCFLEPESRLVAIGDLVGSGAHMTHMLARLWDITFSTVSIETWVRSMQKLLDMGERYDAMLGGHDEQPLGKEYLERHIELAQTILDGTAQPTHPVLPERYGVEAWMVEGDDVRIIYHDEVIFDKE